jgi:hypothetical protein
MSLWPTLSAEQASTIVLFTKVDCRTRHCGERGILSVCFLPIERRSFMAVLFGTEASKLLHLMAGSWANWWPRGRLSPPLGHVRNRIILCSSYRNNTKRSFRAGFSTSTWKVFVHIINIYHLYTVYWAINWSYPDITLKYVTEMEAVYKDLVTREDQSDHCRD